MVHTEILEQQTQSTVILKRKKSKIYKKNLNTPKVACNRFGIYTVKEVHSSFPKQKLSSNGGVGLHNALNIQVTESGRIFNTDYHHSNENKHAGSLQKGNIQINKIVT